MSTSRRTFWQYLKGPMHTIELHLGPTEVQLKEYKPEGGDPVIQSTSLEDFLKGGLHEAIKASMNATVLPEAIESARAMKAPLKNAYLEPILQQAATLPQRMREALGQLNEAQLNWKPNPETWSVGECLEHLLIADRSYLPQLEALARGDKHVSFWEKLPLFHGMWGRMLIKMTGPVVNKKAKAPGAFKPTRSRIPATIVEDFLSVQAKTMAAARALDSLDHEKVIITSPAASLITYSLHDALVIIFQHDERHFTQAKNLLARPEFPKG